MIQPHRRSRIDYARMILFLIGVLTIAAVLALPLTTLVKPTEALFNAP